jgi:hypothetical protein
VSDARIKAQSGSEKQAKTHQMALAWRSAKN